MLLKEVAQYKNDYSPDAGKALTDKQLELAYKAVAKNELSREDIKRLAAELSENEEFGRTAGSAEFLLNRMHILVHGIAPHGETEKRAETMFTIPKKMIEFANRKGLDTFENIKSARAELKNRRAKVKRPEALKMMAAYYKEHKNELPKDIAKHREEIVGHIMNGMKPEEAFAKYSK